MHGHHNDPHPNPERQAQDVLPRGRVHVNGAPGGPVSEGGNKAPPGGNGKAPPGNGAEGKRSLPERVTALEAEHKHLATKADLEKGLRATERRLSKKVQAVRKEARATERRLSKQIQKGRDETRRMPYVILVGMAALATIFTYGPQAIEWLRGAMLG